MQSSQTSENRNVWVLRPIKRIGDFFSDLSEVDKIVVRRIARRAGTYTGIQCQRIYWFFKDRAAEHARQQLERQRIRERTVVELEAYKSEGYGWLGEAAYGAGPGHNRSGSSHGVLGGRFEVRALQLEDQWGQSINLPRRFKETSRSVVEWGGS